MENELIKLGFKKVDEDEWIKDDVTIRFFGNEFELFENPDVIKNAKYFRGSFDKDTLEITQLNKRY